MGVRAMAYVWGLSEGIERTEKFVLLSLADYADDEGYCWPSVKTIATKAMLSERRTQQLLRSLHTKGFLESSPGGPRGTMYYRIQGLPAFPSRSAGIRQARHRGAVAQSNVPASSGKSNGSKVPAHHADPTPAPSLAIGAGGTHPSPEGISPRNNFTPQNVTPDGAICTAGEEIRDGHNTMDFTRSVIEPSPEDTSPPVVPPRGGMPPRKKPKPALTPTVTPAFVERMIQDYADVWSEQRVRETISLALSHKAARNYLPNPELYVQNWLRKDANQEGQTHGNGTRAAPVNDAVARADFGFYKTKIPVSANGGRPQRAIPR